MLLLRHCECSEKNVDAVVVAGNVNAALSEKNVDCGCYFRDDVATFKDVEATLEMLWLL